MSPIHWTKGDVIKRVQEAMTPQQPKAGLRPNVLQNLVDKARLKIKGKPGEGEQSV